MSVDMSQFAQMFFEEAEELLAQVEQLLIGLDVERPEQEALHAIFRAAHSIKGGSATFGFQDITEITHVLENLLDRVRQGEMGLSGEKIDAFLAAKDVVRMLLCGHRDRAEVDPAQVEAVRRTLEALANDGAAAAAAAVPAPEAVPEPCAAAPSLEESERTPDAETDAGVNRLTVAIRRIAEDDVPGLIEEMGILGRVLASERSGEALRLTLETDVGAEDVRGLCAFVVSLDDVDIGAAPAPAADSAQAAAPAPDQAPAAGGVAAVKREVAATTGSPSNAKPSDKSAGGTESSSIRVGVEKVDQLINLVGELVITQAMIEQLVSATEPVDYEKLRSGVSQLTRNTRDLQEAVMSIRMMQMDTVFSRFPRMVRDLAGKLGKKIEFVTQGGATELDKGLIEKIIDPLTHLVRNSIDHGIETPEARLAAGKPEQGSLTLSAAHQGGKIVVRVKDDGKGLARERILQKARERGIATSAEPSEQEIFQLIFAPGFSTADAVTDVSGRGVGMDVVKRNITTLGGSVDIQSEAGVGTTVSISVPLTLAILDGMSVAVGGELFILPLGYIVESLQPRAEDLRSVLNGGTVVRVRGDYLQVVMLHELFNIPSKVAALDQGIIVILESDGAKKALFVDALVGQHQVVIKSLESNYRKVAGISGATIMGDGRVAMILDVAHIVGASRGRLDKAA